MARPRLLEVCHQTFDDDLALQMISSAYALANIWTLDKKCLRVLPPTPPCYLNVTLTGFQSVHFPSNVRHYTQERSFLTLRDKKSVNLEKLTLDQ